MTPATLDLRGDVHHHMLIAAFYGFADSSEHTYVAFAELQAALQAYGGHFIVVGDYNVTQDEGPTSHALATGTLRSADEAAVTGLPATSLGDIRRIDYALQHPSLFALGVITERRVPLSDHAIVVYDYGQELYPPTWRTPRLREPSAYDSTEVEQSQHLDAREPAIRALLESDHVEAAWVELSDLAEAILGVSAAVFVVATFGTRFSNRVGRRGLRSKGASLLGADTAAKRHCAARCRSADQQQWDLELTNAKAFEETMVSFTSSADGQPSDLDTGLA